MLYYRVAFRVEQADSETASTVRTQLASWRWRSTVLISTHALFTLLRTYKEIPKGNIRIFFSPSEEIMDEMLARQNRGLISSSLTAEQFLVGRSINILDIQRLSCELSVSKDHDLPYVFRPPTHFAELLAWTKLLVRVQRGELIP